MAVASNKPPYHKTSGVFSEHLGATPKYATGRNQTGAGQFKDTMARLFLSFEPKDAKPKKRLQEYLDGLSDDRLKTLARKFVNWEVPPANGKENPPKALGRGYIEFLLQSASHRYQEKIDVIETLADRYAAYSYGSAPPTFTYTVALLNNKQDDQATNMYRVYWHLLRATRLAGIKAEVYFQYDGMIVAGAMTDFSWTLQAPDESYCQGNFGILVRKVLFMNFGSSDSLSDYDSVSGNPEIEPAGGGTNLTGLGTTYDAAGNPQMAVEIKVPAQGGSQ